MREWKDYENGLDYEDLVKVHKETHGRERVQEKQRNTLNTATHLIGGSIGRILGTAIVVFAISVLFSMVTARLPNTKGVIEFKIKIDSLENQATAVVPGTEQSISTTITNDSGQQMYIFVRLNMSTYDGNNSIYSFTPDNGDDLSWSVIDGVGESGQIVLAWTESNGKLRKVDAQDSVVLSGKLTCVVPIQYFDGLSDSDMIVDFDGFGISTEESDDPKQAYQTNVVGRGK